MRAALRGCAARRSDARVARSTMALPCTAPARRALATAGAFASPHYARAACPAAALRPLRTQHALSCSRPAAVRARATTRRPRTSRASVGATSPRWSTRKGRRPRAAATCAMQLSRADDDLHPHHCLTRLPRLRCNICSSCVCEAPAERMISCRARENRGVVCVATAESLLHGERVSRRRLCRALLSPLHVNRAVRKETAARGKVQGRTDDRV